LKGTYTLLLVCNNSFGRRIGRSRYLNISRGYYLYTGSALGQGSVSLEGRLKRHSRASKKTKWHVDYLTSRSNCTIRAAVCLQSRKRLECSIARAISAELSVEPVFPRAGSSDCSCEAHLVKVLSSRSERGIREALIKVYMKFGRPLLF
jgi:Uri superfamily endonuclease